MPAQPPQRPLGRTGLTVSALALGGGHLGALGEHDAAALLSGALDLGVNLIDVAPSYGAAEAHVGRCLAPRRHDLILSTKGGYGVPGVPDWSAAAITLGIERALRTLRTDVIDIFHLHSCPLDVLQRDDILGAVGAARAAGKIRVAAYSGEGDALAFAIRSGCFGAVQTSINLFDQRGLDRSVPEAAALGLGVLAKRPLGNAPWRFPQRPAGHYAEVYWERMQRLALPVPSAGWLATALRFSLFAPGVSAALAGTASLAHLQECVAACRRGPLPTAEFASLRAAFQQVGGEWPGQI